MPKSGSRIASALLVCFVCMAVTLPLQYAYLWLPPSVSKWMGVADSWSYFVPGAFFLDSSIRGGEFPLWNPLILCGQPFAANPQSAAFYPPNLLRSVLMFAPTAAGSLVSLRILAVAHLALAFVGMFCFVRDHRLSNSAAVVGAFTFAYCTLFSIYAVGQWVCLAAFSWLPVLMLLLRRALLAQAARQRVVYGLCLGMIFGMSLLAGHPQSTSYVGLALGAYAVAFRLLERVGNGEPAKPGWVSNIGSDALVFGLLLAVAVLVGAAVLLPGLELAELSTRGRGAPLSVAVKAPYPIRLLPYHLHVGVLLLACAALTRRPRRDAILYLVLFYVGFDCFVGTHLPIGLAVRRFLPYRMGSSNWSSPMWAFPLGVLAAYGLDALGRWKPGTVRAVALAGVGVGCVALYAWWPFTRMPSSWFLRLFPLVTTMAIATAGAVTTKRLLRPLILVLVVAEGLAWNAYAVSSSISRSLYEGDMAKLSGRVEMSKANRRYPCKSPNTLVLELTPEMTGAEPAQLLAVQTVLAPSESQYARIVTVKAVTARNHMGNLLLKRRFWLARQYVDADLPPRTQSFPVATTAFLKDAPPLPVPEIALSELPARSVSETVVETDLTRRLLGRATRTKTEAGFEIAMGPVEKGLLHGALRLHYTSAGEARLETVLRDVRSDRWVYGKQHVLPPRPQGNGRVEIPLPDFAAFECTLSVFPAGPGGDVRFTEAYLLSDQNDEDRLINILSARANSIDLEVGPLEGHRILTFVDAAYPGWRAHVDGEEVPILLAAGAFKAIVLPPGIHRVTFEFRPWRVYVGLGISVFGVLSALGALTWIGLGEKRRKRA